MIAPQIPANEAERLRALAAYEIIGEVEQSDFDFITQMAAEICQTEIALVSLVTQDKQWFLSHHGIAERETPREIAFCAHAINTPYQIFQVENAAEDERFAPNPLVTDGPKIGFYAGIPLVNNEGFALGTLCAIDSKPQKLTPHQEERLQLLANQVISLLELRKKVRENESINNALVKNMELLQESHTLNKMGAWELDVKTQKTTWTKEIYNIYEVEEDFPHNQETSLKFVADGYREKLATAIQNAVLHQMPFNLTVLFFGAKGTQKWLRITGKAWKENNAQKVIGSLQDVTEQKNTSDQLVLERQRTQNFLDGANVGLWEWNIQTGQTAFNERWAEMLGYSLKELHPTNIETWRQFIHPQDFQIFENNFSEAIASEDHFYKAEYRMRHKNGTWVWVLDHGKIFSWTAEGRPHKAFGTRQDITIRKNSESEIKGLLTVAKDQNERLRNFAYIVSHNLRSHAGGLSMLIDLIAEESPEFLKNELFAHFKNGVLNLGETIQHLTEVVQINLSAREKNVAIPLSDVVNKTIQSLMPIAQKNGVTIENHVVDHLAVLALPAYLESIVMNFLSNAIKYKSDKRPGLIEVTAKNMGEMVQIDFKDNGQGIDLNRHGEKLFRLYHTFHKHEDSRGVGLFITKNQIEAMGGKVTVDSTVDVGTTFSVFLPASATT